MVAQVDVENGPSEATVPVHQQQLQQLLTQRQSSCLSDTLQISRLRQQQQQQQQTRCLNTGPLRAVRLCILGITLPGLLIALPIYMRYHVYSQQMYPVGMSDMRRLDTRMSTTWCQRQVIHANTTFNAFLLDRPPSTALKPITVTMSRGLVLEDDMKEYWAFYLLRGSVVTISSCSRYEGASLVVVRGYKHLHECAYIGDDSSEEEDELAELKAEEDELIRKAASDAVNTYKKKDDTGQVQEGESNEPTMMRRARPGVILHNTNDPFDSTEQLDHHEEHLADDHGTDNKVLELLNKVKSSKINTAKVRPKQAPDSRSSSSMEEASSSSEIYAEIAKRLDKLDDHGKSVLERLKTRLLKEMEDDKENEKVKQTEEQVEAMLGRVRRQTSFWNEQLLRDTLGRHDDEDDNVAIEEGLSPDGIADHHAAINNTDPRDRSNSEFWSSFSSSEEALLSCAGLVLNLPLVPSRQCKKDSQPDEHHTASHPNTITYKIPSNGYYFFIFGSENEVQPNFIGARFVIEKIVYDVSYPVAQCLNSTDSCSLPLGFFSSETAIVEVPVPNQNATLWNEEFVAISTCEPRTAVYLGCVLAVPLLILIFAFQ